jgi:hypothetical protein
MAPAELQFATSLCPRLYSPIFRTRFSSLPNTKPPVIPKEVRQVGILFDPRVHSNHPTTTLFLHFLHFLYVLDLLYL